MKKLCSYYSEQKDTLLECLLTYWRVYNPPHYYIFDLRLFYFQPRDQNISWGAPIYIPVYYKTLDVAMKYVFCIILTINANDFLK